MRLRVPGNLLLLGEYAVMEEGGLGLALAVGKPLEVELHSAPAAVGLSVEGRWPGGSVSWSETCPDASPLIREAVQASRAELASRGEAPPGTGARIRIDSRSFFTEGGQKRGFGSSAAVAVGLCRAVLGWAGLGEPALSEATLSAALRAHRAAQGGTGSGYDVYASCHGGMGLFTGGHRPRWRRVDLPWLEPLYWFRGLHSVSTPGAVQRYREWKSRAARRAASFLRRSNRWVERFVAAGSWEEAAEWFRALTELGIWLGEAIGVPARIQPPPELAGGACKALGAGNELGICRSPTHIGAPPEGSERLWLEWKPGGG